MVFLKSKFKYLAAILSLVFLFAIIYPIVANAANAGESCDAWSSQQCNSIVCCGNGDASHPCCDSNGKPSGCSNDANCYRACTFNDMFCLVQKIVNFILFTLIPPLAVIWFAYAGFTILTAAGNPAKAKQGRDMITYAFLGMLLAYSAWLLVYWFVNVIGGENQADWLLNFFKGANP